MNTTFYKKLANNVQIVYRETTSQVSYVGIMIGSGTRDELSSESGIAHFIEHCVFKGTPTMTARDIINKIEGVGGEINAYTTKEETTYYAATPNKQWKKTLTMLADMVLRPTFPQKEIDKEVGVILDEIDSYEDSPSELIYDDFENMLFDGSPLAFPILSGKSAVTAVGFTVTFSLSGSNYSVFAVNTGENSSFPIVSRLRFAAFFNCSIAESEQSGNIVCCRFPYDGFIHLGICVGNPVSHAANHSPRHFFLRFFTEFIGKTVCQFSDLQNAHRNGV